MNKDFQYIKEIDNYRDLYNAMLFSEVSGKYLLEAIDERILNLLREKGADVNAFVIHAIIQSILGNRQRAASVANNIWDIGEGFEHYAKVAYINLLIDLGFLDMASVILKDKLDNIEANFENFLSVMLKYAVMVGDAVLINKIINISASDDRTSSLLYEVMTIYRDANYLQHFKEIMNILFENCKDYVCACDYMLYDDRGFADLEVVVYVSSEAGNTAYLHKKMEADIEECFLAKGASRIYNLGFRIVSVDNHPALIS